MSDETIDAGLAELTEDVLGPDPSAPVETQSQPVEAGAEPSAAAEPAQPQPVDASAPAPTAIPTGPDSFVVDGKTYTKADILALNTTKEQFAHLQRKWTEAKRAEAERGQSPQQPAQQAQPQAPALSPQQLQSEIRRSFDPVVKDMVDKGFMEPDLAELYPDAMAGIAMRLEVLTSTVNLVAQMQNKINAYEAEISADKAARYKDEVESGIRNNMVALSTQGGIFGPLNDGNVRDAFFQYLVRLDPWPAQYEDPEYIADAYAAFKRKELASGVVPQAPNPAALAAKQTARRQAKGDATTGSRPSAGPVINPTVLQEMVDDHLMRGQ